MPRGQESARGGAARSVQAVPAPEGAVVCQDLDLLPHGLRLGIEEAGDGGTERGVGDPVQRMRLDRKISARELVFALRAGLHPGETPGDGMVRSEERRVGKQWRGRYAST